ncbi:MAG: hypothetical protein PWP23_1418 [Candidatus Sumerlaeota bacterium]|nr:hypothetical protein [Candidatus Sumerlaeota bacterium]
MSTPFKVLVAEDDEPTRQILCRRLRDWDYEPIEAADGEEALRVLAEPDGPRMVLLDWILPGADGLEVCRELDRRPNQPRIYRIILTIKNKQEDMIRALDGGADDCIAKPVSPTLLRSRLNVGRRFVDLDAKLHEKARELQALAHEMATQYMFQKALLDAVPIPVFVKDYEGYYLACNNEYTKVVGLPEHEIIGKTLFDIWKGEPAVLYKRMDDELYEKGTVQQYEAPVQYADGARREVIFQKAVFKDPEGGKAGIVGAMLDITERKNLERELGRLATTDALTGVMNRRHFIELAEKELARVKRYGGDAALLILDLDHFKKINDTYGHSTGDEALKFVSNTCVASLREGDLFGRLGGEEFAVLLPQTPPLRGIEVAERLRKALSTTAFHPEGGKPHLLTVSIGVAALLPSDKNIDTVIERADVAMYRAKDNGRNRVEMGEAGSDLT